MKRFAKRFMDLKIASKIMTCYVVMLLIFLTLGSVTYQQFQSLTTSKVRQMSSETTRSVGNSLDFLFDTVNNQSMILLSSQTVQSALEQSGQRENFTLQTKVCNYLADFMNFNNLISSIYVFDRSGMEYYVDSTSFKNMSLQKISQASWYRHLVSLNGGYLLKLNGGGTFTVTGENYISLVRVVNSINTQKPIGLLVMNVSADSIQKNVMRQNSSYDMQFLLKDETGRSILNTTPGVKNVADTIGEIPPGDSTIRHINGGNYIVSNLSNQYGWGISTITPFQELTRQVVTTNITLVAVLLVSVLLFFAAFLFISLLITRPIRKLASSMKAVENGNFQEIQIKTGNDEIGHLKDVYNMMVHRIVLLIDDIIREQTVKRKKELEVLQMQIKPHFLYNSFDAIASLSLSGKNNDVFRMVQSLGRYYRGFLSACDEAITIEKELEITDHYITIQRIRFPDKFTVVKSIDPEVLQCKMPSLTLQPLVENAINHGIRGKSGPGTLTIRASALESAVRLTVEDDGIGMDEEQIAEILEGRSKGVGMKATMEKLNLYFESDHILTIQSDKGSGTKVTINIPADRGNDNGASDTGRN